MPDLDALMAAYRMTVAGLSYERNGIRMDATFRLVMDGERFDEALHDRLVDAHDGIDDDTWRIEALDTDLDDSWGTCILRVEALTAQSCRILQACVLRTLPDFS